MSRKSSPPKDNKREVRFEKCDCGTGGPHGYFSVTGKGTFPLPNLSVETAKIVLQRMAREYGLTPETVTAVEAQICAAGLPAEMGDRERTMVREAMLSLISGGLRGILPLDALID